MPRDEGMRVSKSPLVCEAKVHGTDHAGSRGLAAHQRELNRLLEWAQSDGLDGGILRAAELRARLVLHVWRQKPARAREAFALMRDFMNGGASRSSPRPRARHQRPTPHPGPKPLQGTARIAAPGRVAIEGSDAGTLLASRILVATGSTPATLPGVELDQSRIVSSEEALSFEAVLARLLVIGAGAVGLELGAPGFRGLRRGGRGRHRLGHGRRSHPRASGGRERRGPRAHLPPPSKRHPM